MLFFSKYPALDTVSRLIVHLLDPKTRARAYLACTAVLEGLSVLSGLLVPLFWKRLIDTVPQHNVPRLVLFGLTGAYVTVWAANAVISTGRMLFSTRALDRLTHRLADQVLRAGLSRAASGHDRDSGDIMGLIERLPFSLAIVVDGLLWRTVPLALQAVASLLVVAALVPWQYVAILIVVLLTYVAATAIGSTRHMRLAEPASAAAAGVSQNLGDILRNARRVVFNGAVEMEMGRMAALYQQRELANATVLRSLLGLVSVQYLIIGAGLVCLIYFSALDVANGRMTLGDFVLLQGYALGLAIPLGGLGYIISQSSVALAHLSDVLNLASLSAAAEHVPEAPVGPADVVLDNISFSYGPGLPGPSDISAIIPAGSFTVIVGPNGSGKSTLAQLIGGNLNPHSGEIRIGGRPLSPVPKAQRWRFALYVPQFIGLFNRSLRANAFYPPSRQSEEAFLEFVEMLEFYGDGRPVDLDAGVGEQGERLSGGQLQKLELGRVAGVRVPVVVADESTSALDQASESLAMDLLKLSLRETTTIIMVTHSVQIAERADLVLFMKNGQLKRQGTHAHLLRDSESYRVFRRQVLPVR